MEKATPSMTSANAVLLLATFSSALGIVTKAGGVLALCVTIGTGIGGSKAVLSKRRFGRAKPIGPAAAKGAVIGFWIGVPLGVAAGIALAVT